MTVRTTAFLRKFGGAVSSEPSSRMILQKSRRSRSRLQRPRLRQKKDYETVVEQGTTTVFFFFFPFLSFSPAFLAWHPRTGRGTDEPTPQVHGPSAIHLQPEKATIHEDFLSPLLSCTLLSRPFPGLELLPAHRRPTSVRGSYENLAMTAPAAPVYETRAAVSIDADVPSG
ncbi:uncharacterized protein LY79DRAFT_406843 [Colletotrichum navitas]|uniref:Uncharacterized protein n=1 Tax=Colletotrichum navitas TaxID=681940 RepID=A0AAD8Q763_9PEZI|nr:uncharacterized protein LY79DRAFT_406843 [Colletotrichum navitas]KAK1597173.1 hypothetical protein LY79DRAFT_406843 [Colletotrichum navitas]